MEVQLITITRNDGHYRIQTRLSSYWASRDQQLTNFNNLASQASQRFEQSYAHNIFIRLQFASEKIVIVILLFFFCS